ncbi:hypothetical protein MVEN_01622100 [Mycena venus]|uniref:Uncharacterized protein n=1 Tax=Mycena venus TaxID=2733690 RepID=A0A8H6XTF4_9AGAR|nr:hypothetical protein MVEN_01622100 [Mycena venus]
MHSAFILFALATVAVSTAVKPIPGEGVYSATNLADLPHDPVNFTRPLANKLLDVLEKHRLTKVRCSGSSISILSQSNVPYWSFGGVGLHSHVSLGPGQVLAQHGNSSVVTQGIAVYDDVKDASAPYSYHITAGDSPALLPLDVGDITSGVLAARNDLVTVLNGDFLKDFAAAASGNLVGIAYIRSLDRAAVEHSQVVKFNFNTAKASGTSSAVGLAEIATGVPTFATRGVANSTAASDITILCVCDDWRTSCNPWLF